MITTALFIYTETSLHAGVGSTVSAIDLPIQRERTTQFPIVQGSGVKGALRSQIVNAADRHPEVESTFGGTKKNDKNEDVSYAGAFSAGDARIVLFPVRSLAGVFAYVTCPAVLARVARDVTGFPAYKFTLPNENALVTSTTSSKVVIDSGKASTALVLEEFSFKAERNDVVDKIADWLCKNALPADAAYSYWRDKLRSSLVILPDDAFRDFVLNSTEVATRVHLDDATKTVKQGQLWTQESLPADCLLMSTVVVRSARDGSGNAADKVKSWLQDTNNIPTRIQLGGDETTGQGMVALRWA